jgi:hypothetical protein
LSGIDEAGAADYVLFVMMNIFFFHHDMASQSRTWEVAFVRLQARQPHQKRPTNARHWTFVQQMDGPKKVDRSTFEMLTLKSTFKMLTLKSTFFGISM